MALLKLKLLLETCNLMLPEYNVMWVNLQSTQIYSVKLMMILMETLLIMLRIMEASPMWRNSLFTVLHVQNVQQTHLPVNDHLLSTAVLGGGVILVNKMVLDQLNCPSTLPHTSGSNHHQLLLRHNCAYFLQAVVGCKGTNDTLKHCTF